MREDGAAWLCLAYRSTLPTPDQLRVALGDGPNERAFPAAVVLGERGACAELTELGVELLAVSDEAFPAAVREDGSFLVLQVAGRVALLDEPGVAIVAGPARVVAERLGELTESGGRAVVVLSKGLLKARTMLRALAEPIADGSIALVSAEPPRASWGPGRDVRRDRLARLLSRG